MFSPVPYRKHFVCFNCRLSIKAVDCAICRHCKKPLVDLGRKFRTPPRAHVKQWQKIQLLHENGWTGWSWNVSPQMTLRVAEDYLKNKPRAEKAAQTQRKQEEQNEKWRKMRKWPHIRP